MAGAAATGPTSVVVLSADAAGLIGRQPPVLRFGFRGRMVAVPLLAAVIVPLKLCYVRGVVGDAVYEDADEPDGAVDDGSAVTAIAGAARAVA